jgi:hypothetical protein
MAGVVQLSLGTRHELEELDRSPNRRTQ